MSAEIWQTCTASVTFWQPGAAIFNACNIWLRRPGRSGGPWGEAAGRPSPMPDTGFVWSILIAEINKTNIMKCFIRALRECKVTFNRKGLIVDRTEAITYKRLHNKIFRRVPKRLSQTMNFRIFFKNML